MKNKADVMWATTLAVLSLLIPLHYIMGTSLEWYKMIILWFMMCVLPFAAGIYLTKVLTHVD